jgi:hypothetical protein
VKESNVYRTESGTIFRVTDDGDGHISVRVLKETGWQDGSIGMVGLRVAPTTVRLTEKQILRLPE